MRIYPMAMKIKPTADGNWVIGMKIDPDEYEMFMTEYKQEKSYQVDIDRYFPPASVKQQAYFHKLLRDLAKVMRMSFEDLKLEVLITDGIEVVQEIEGNEAVATMTIPKLGKEMPTRFKANHFYLEQIAEDKHNYIYRMYKGISLMTSRELSIVIDRLMDRCDEQGMKIIPPNVYKQMKRSWDNGDDEEK